MRCALGWLRQAVSASSLAGRRRTITVVLAWMAAVAAALAVAGPAWADPALVSDINPGAASSSPQDFAVVGQTLFFFADDGFHGFELWRSDGTAAGTSLVKDINSAGSASSHLNGDLVNVGGTVFFNATDGVSGFELWKSDGTAAGTVMVKRINSVSVIGSNPLHLTDVGGTLFFTADDGTNGRELWKSDGTEAGTTLVKDINAGSGSANPTELVDVGGRLFFQADDGVHGEELWTSDGTDAGTTMVKDINPGGGSASIGEPTNVNGTLFFSAFDGNLFGLWKSDGTSAGTVLVKNLGSVPEHLTNVAGTLFFSADDGNNGRELWKSDGTDAGTSMVKDIWGGQGSSNPDQLADFNGTLFFQASDGADGVQLWESDGTAAGTMMVTDINPGGDSFPAGFTSSGGQLYFSAFEGTHGRELWRTDGTAPGTTLVADINPGSGNSDPGPLADVNGTLFFGANDGTHGDELWSLGGAPAGRSTATDVSCVPGSVAVGQASTCTVIVTDTGNGAPSTPTGKVSFSSDSHGGFGNPGPSCALSEVSTGQASCQVDYTPSAVDTGTHHLTGSYGGDGAHAGSAGNANVTVTAPAQRPTSTSTSCSPGSVTVGRASTCTAIVTDTGGGAPVTPSGTVSFSSDSHGTFGSGGSCALAGNGTSVASCGVTYTPAAVDSGTHTIAAAYPGDAAHSPSNGRGSVTVSPRPPVLLPPPVNTGPPVNHLLPSISPAQSCVTFLTGRRSCQPIPYTYTCNPGQWTGNDPAVPYKFEWQESVLLGAGTNTPFQDFPTRTTGQVFQYGPAFAGGSGIWRCRVTATAPDGTTEHADSSVKGQPLQGSINLNRGRNLRLFPSPVDIRVTGIEVTQGTQETTCPGCRFVDPNHTICATCYAGTLPSGSGLVRYSGVTMAAGKDTIVRVYANFTDPDASRGLTSLSGATASLEVDDSSLHAIRTFSPVFAPVLTLPSPACPQCVDAKTRANPASSFYFRIPAQYTNHRSLTFKATVSPPPPPNQPSQCDFCDENKFTLYNVPFKQPATVTIDPIPLDDRGVPGDPRTSLSLSQIFGSAQIMFPNPVQWQPWDGTLDVEGLGTDDAAEAVEDRASDNNVPSNVYPVGVFFQGESGGLGGTTENGPGRLFTSDGPPISIVPDYRPVTGVAHEIAHGMAIGHADNSTPHPDGTADCGGGLNNQPGEGWAPDYEGRIQGVGLDVRGWQPYLAGSLPSTFVEGFDHQGAVAPGSLPLKPPASGPPWGSKYYDFMSYCPPGPSGTGGVILGPQVPTGVQYTEPLDWISPHNWQRLIDYYAPAQTLPAAADAAAGAAMANPLRVIATVHAGGPTTIHDVTPGERLHLRSTPGSPYRIELRDAAGRLLTSAVPATVPLHTDGVTHAPDLMLAATLPFSTRTAAVVITADGQVLVRRMRSTHAPVGRFVSPRPNSRVGRSRTTVVRWTEHDADGDHLTATVDYSANGGRTWRVVAGPLRGSSVRIPSGLLSASRNARLRVRISDGFNLTTIESGRLRAAGAPPTVQIVGAPARARVPQTAILPLQGWAFDDAGRALTGRHLRWYLGKRLIGFGEQVTAQRLRPGNTTIRLVATDSHGRSAQASFPLRVTAVAARYLLFWAPLQVSPRARSVRITAASTLPATFTIGGKHYALGARERTITVRIRPARTLLLLPCSLRSPGGIIRDTYVAAR